MNSSVLCMAHPSARSCGTCWITPLGLHASCITSHNSRPSGVALTLTVVMEHPAQELIYPQLYRYILHPCVSWPGMSGMCGGLHTATGDLRFDSFLTQENVVIMLIYEVLLFSSPAHSPPLCVLSGQRGLGDPLGCMCL